jgi:dipeptidyl aminopeptidase/acylaminoacyl peptidase
VSGFDLQRYLTIRRAYGASLGPEGTLAFLLDTTGTAQVWTLAEPGSWPRQRTFYDDPVSFVSSSPERPELVFGMDEGGNERMQLFRLGPDGSVVRLTDRPEAKHRWGGWSHDGERFAFASNRRDDSVFDVYVQGRDEREPERVFEGDGWFSVGPWRPDDGAVVLREAHSNFDHDLSVLELATNERRPLTTDTDGVRYGSPQWGPDGEWLYLVTDEDSDTLYLARMDPTSGVLETVREGGDWNVGGVAVEESGLLVYSRNVEGYTDLTVARIEDGLLDLATPEIPGSVAGGVSFGPDGERFALSSSGRALNTNVSVVDIDALEERTAGAEVTREQASAVDDLTGEQAPAGETTARTDGESRADPAVTRWSMASTAGIPRETFAEPELVRYETFDDREIPAFFSLPAEIPEAGVPVVVDIHGGPESQRRPSFSGLRQYFLARGYALFEPNVRGSTGYGRRYTHLDDVEQRMDSVRDIGAALDWLADHGAVDADRFVAKGGSYGGFMVLASLAEFPDRWAAGVDVVGIANFVTFLENTGSWRRELREAEYGSLEEDRELLESISPLDRADRIDAPLFVLHGANDPRVPLEEAEQIVSALERRSIPVELLVFEDEGHGIAKLENQIEAYTRVVEFLEEHV